MRTDRLTDRQADTQADKQADRRMDGRTTIDKRKWVVRTWSTFRS